MEGAMQRTVTRFTSADGTKQARVVQGLIRDKRRIAGLFLGDYHKYTAHEYPTATAVNMAGSLVPTQSFKTYPEAVCWLVAQATTHVGADCTVEQYTEGRAA
jgi:hypothetical protein